MQFAQTPVPVGNVSQYPAGNVASQAMGAMNPMFGRPIWTYTSVVSSPLAGPSPRLARGTGRTGGNPGPGQNALLPAYLTDNEYFPTEFAYQPGYIPSYRSNIPRTINAGDDGISVLGTYRAHDFTPADRFFHQNRQAPTWQVQEFPPNHRNLLAWQQVQKYRVASVTRQARVLDSSNYFLGYQVSKALIGQIGQTTLGVMGSQ